MLRTLLDPPKLTRSPQLREVRRAAHTLKSNGRTFGATALASLSEELDLSAQTGMLAGAGELVGRVENEYARVEAALGALAGRG